MKDRWLETLDTLRGGLIVSCQAAPGSPMDRPEILAAFARCAEIAGAVGIRANYPPNIAAITQAVQLPVLGILKREVAGYEVYITPEFVDAEAVAVAGAHIIAIDATDRPRPGRDTFEDLVRRVHLELGLPVMADISTYEEGIQAAESGADLVATTMSGYTAGTAAKLPHGPDIDLVNRLAARISVPVVCEGRIHSPAQVREALEAGAYAVVVGTAITAPVWITEQYIKALPGHAPPANPST
jgi:N-acylglucosamine-6-phosphate 2-epimerase